LGEKLVKTTTQQAVVRVTDKLHAHLKMSENENTNWAMQNKSKANKDALLLLSETLL
jgi:hypothetical protein